MKRDAKDQSASGAKGLVVADTHVHLYARYDLRAALTALTDNLARGAGRTGSSPATMAACLVERSDCDWFRGVRDGAGLRVGADLEVQMSSDPACLQLRRGDACVWLFAGRQVVTREGLEILALVTDQRIPDRLCAVDAIRQIQAGGGVPVIGWAPGKWMFRRRKIVSSLLDRFAAQSVQVGDTSLRPALWPASPLLRDALRKGYNVLAGSDPLPFSGEERQLGTWATVFNGEFDERAPAASMRAILSTPGSVVGYAGQRNSLPSVVQRLLRNEWVRRRGKPISA